MPYTFLAGYDVWVVEKAEMTPLTNLRLSQSNAARMRVFNQRQCVTAGLHVDAGWGPHNPALTGVGSKSNFETVMIRYSHWPAARKGPQRVRAMEWLRLV